MKAYLNPLLHPTVWIAALFGGAATVSLAYLLIRGGNAVYMTIPMIGYLLAGILVFQGALKYLDFHETLKKLQAQGKYEELNLEFGKAKPMMNYRVRFGARHLFVKGSGVIMNYGDIKDVSLQKLINGRGRGDVRASIRTPYGTVPLGIVEASRVRRGELEQFMAAIRQRSASVQAVNC